MRMNRFKIYLLLAFLFAGASCTGVVRQAERAAEEERYVDAVKLYQQYLIKHPDDVEAKMRLFRLRDMGTKHHLEKGGQLLESGKLDEAEAEYNKAKAVDPTYNRAQIAINEIKRKREAQRQLDKAKDLLADSKSKEAFDSARKAYDIDPRLEEAKQISDRIASESQQGTLNYDLDLKSSKPVSLKFRDANIKEVFEVLAKLSGINFVFDDTIKDTRITVFVEEATFVQSLEMILFTNKLALKVINPRNIIIYPDNKQKRKEYEEYYIRTFFLKYSDAKKMVNNIRNLIEARQIIVNEEVNGIIIRGDADAIELAAKIIEANDIAKPEVMLNLEFLEVNRNDAETLGIRVNPQSISAGAGYPLDPATGNLIRPAKIMDSAPPTAGMGGAATANMPNWVEISRLRTSKDIFFTVPTATLDFLKSNGLTKTLANPQLRAIDGAKASVHVGDRVPVITVTVSGADQRSENVQYIDVGVKFNAEPKILTNNEVDIKVDAEVSTALKLPETKNGTTVYQIGTRSFKTNLRLKEGETTVIGGLIRDSKTTTKNGFPLLSNIPGLGWLFSSFDTKDDRTDIYISITPFIAKGIEFPTSDVTKIWSGTDERPSSKPLFQTLTESQVKNTGVVKTPVVPSSPKPAQPVQPQVVPQQAPVTPPAQSGPAPSPQQPQSQPPSQPQPATSATSESMASEEIFAATVAPASVSVGETAEIDFILSGLPDTVEIELSAYVNNIFLEMGNFIEAGLRKNEADFYQGGINQKSGTVSITAKLVDGISGSFSVGKIEIKGKNKINNLVLVNIQSAKIRTKDGKQYSLKTLNSLMDVK